MDRPFLNRRDAGQQLAPKLMAYAHRSDVLVLALPRGGVPVAYEIVKHLKVPLDLCLVRKLGAPGHPELAMGAIAPGGVRVLNQDILQWYRVPRETLEAITRRELQELQRRSQVYRGNAPPPDVTGKTVILVDDGVATGSSLRAAIALLQQQQPTRIVVALPVAPPTTSTHLHQEVDEVICLLQPEALISISAWYQDFSQTTDAEVIDLLAQAKALGNPNPPPIS